MVSPGRKPIIAIDGPSGVGKTTLSRRVAARLGFRHVDTGALYRAVAVGAFDAGVSVDDDAALGIFCAKSTVELKEGRVICNGRDYTVRIREQASGDLASRASSKPSVRAWLLTVQRDLLAGGGVVMEGRDIGTVVAPDAEVKIFLDAPAEVRAGRRHNQLNETTGVSGGDVTSIKSEIAERDRRDSTRKISPLKAAADAVHVDTGSHTIDEVENAVFSIIEGKIGDTHS